MFPSRPKALREESEEDLQKEQEKFFELVKAGKMDPSVKQIVKSNDDKKNFTNENPLPSVAIGELPVVERDVSSFSYFSFPTKRLDAFPKPHRRSYSSIKPKQDMAPASSKNAVAMENDELLRGMSEDEILFMRAELISKMDPKLVDFVRNRKRGEPNVVDEPHKKQLSCELKDQRESYASEEISHEEYPVSLDAVQRGRWVNMEIIEDEKLEWTRPIKPSDHGSNSKNARFDFMGELVCREKSVKSGLHHHGHEPDKPGYSFEEVYTFIRSSFDSQRITGLKILAHIMDKVHKGYYDLCFDALLAKECLDNTDMLIWIRKCLDDTSESVIRDTIVCLHALVCNTQVDEACLDRLFPVTMHFDNFLELKPKSQEKSIDENEIRDEILIRMDAIKGILRIDTLPRLRYLLENNIKHREDPLVLNKIFDILIRISRHSSESCKAIVKCPYLFECLTKNFIPCAINFSNLSFYGNPSPKVLKLLRILLSDNDCVSIILETYQDIWYALQAYLTFDPDSFQEENSSLRKSHVLHIAIETLRIWCVLLRLPDLTNAREYFEQIYPIIYRQLQYCLTLNLNSSKYDLQYAATLVKCLVYVVQGNTKLKSGYTSMVESLLFQFVHEFVDLQLIPSFDGSMMMTTCIEFLIIANSSPVALNVNLLNPIMENSRILKKLMFAIKKASFSLQFKGYDNGCKRDAACLPSYGSVYFGGKLIKVVGIAQDCSAIFFLEALLAAADTAKSMRTTSNLVLNEWLISYLKSLVDQYEEIGSSIFKELEYTFIYQVCITSLKLPSDEEKELFFNLALIILYNLSDVKMRENLLNLMLFNAKTLAYFSRESSPLESWESLANSFKHIYFKFSKFDSQYWLFDPIICSYKEKISQEEDIALTLRFCRLILMTSCKNVCEKFVSFDVIFCHIVTTFLLENRLFAEDGVRQELTAFLKMFIEEKLVILSPQESLPHHGTNILNLFEMLLDHFESESFQDSLYINYLLLFLQPSSHPDFAKKLFSDHPICLRFFSLGLDDLIVPIERLLYPISTHSPLIEQFLRNLLGQNIPLSSFLYLVSVHHVHFSLFSGNIVDTADPYVSRCRLSIEKSRNTSLKDHLINFEIESIAQVCPWAKIWS